MFIATKIFATINYRAIFFFSLFFVSLFLQIPSPVFSHTASITTSGPVQIDATTTGNQTSIETDNITITSTCRNGYNLSISTSVNDNNLYLNGNETNNASGTYFSPVDGITILSALPNSWGYLLSQSVPTSNSVFLPVPNNASPVILKTAQETASESDINDQFPIYYGVKTSDNLLSGTYKMKKDSQNNDGTITYYLTMDTSCENSLNISFDKNAGADTVENLPTSSDNVLGNGTLTLSNKRPTRPGYIFQEWNTEPDGSGQYFSVGETIIISESDLSGFVTLYAIWVQNCPASTICYNANHANSGTMTNQEAASNTDNNLTPSNFSRTGYGFASWNTEADGTGTNYGPGQTINPGNISTTGLTLFANWIKPTGTLQTWAGANNMNIGDVIALRDNRDNEVYAVAKLADDNVWITENLRLIPATANITAKNTNGPTDIFLSTYANSTSSDMCSSDNATCDNSVQYNANNLDRTKTASPTSNDNASSWYSFGVMYNWYTATAGNGTYSKTSGSVTSDLCPAGWHMPTGGSSGEWNTLNAAINNGYTNKDPGLRTYPANFIWSGDYNPSNVSSTGRGTQARYWSTTAKDAKNAYRMGFAASTVTATSNGWNKWDGFAIRCIYQGGNAHYYDVNVDFEGTGITSVTFENNNFSTETATPTSPTVNLAEGVSYTITASTAVGYKLVNWTTTANGTLGSTTVNPTTYTISEEATLAATGAEIPIYSVTVNLGEHVTGISFTNSIYGTESLTPASASCSSNNDNTYACTVSLRRGVEYNLTSSYETGYTIDAWATTANGTLGNTTSPATTYIVIGTATLDLFAQEADELSYTLIYNAGLGTDAPDSETVDSYDSTHNFTITNSAPIYYGYTFNGWTETNSGSTVEYVSGDTITVTSTGAETTKTLYAVYTANSCPSGKICYYDNGADVIGGGRNTIANQSASSNSNANLIPSNYSKSGYGFAGWAIDANTTPYGPNATITTPDISNTGLALYAKWVKSTGDLQTWNGCGALTLNNVTALTDTRDNNTYTVTKLADDNCWLMENLRLDPGTANITNQNTHNPTSTFITQSNAGSGSSLSINTMCNSNDSTCFDQIQYNSNNSNRSLNQSHTANTNSAAWYSYGTYYNWYTATAGQGIYNTSNGTSVSGDICPTKWRLPTGNSTGEYNALNTAVNNGATNSDTGLRAYPVNFLWSGDYNNAARNASYSNGRIWTATAKDNNTTYRVGYASNTVTAKTNTYNKWDGFIVRCIFDYTAVDYHNVIVTFPQNVTSVTFTNTNLGTQTATPSSPTVSLVQETPYTITATFASGYTLNTWTNGTNSIIGSTSTNPTTFSITGDSTLTLTIQEIPIHTVTVNLDTHTTSMSFTNANYPVINVVNNNSNGDGTETTTVSLRQGVEYTITGTYDNANHYVFYSWITGANGTLGDSSSSTTTYTITNTSTLSLTSKQKTGSAILLPGQELNAKMKTIAEGTNKEYTNESTKIKILKTANSLPVDFIASSSNTVSVSDSEKPIYIFFDNTNDVGIMYFYTEARDIYMNEDSSYAFHYNSSLNNISILSDWNTSNVINMSFLFSNAHALTNIDALSNWDTSNVTDMSGIFRSSSSMDDKKVPITNIDALSNWDTSNVVNMSRMFYNAISLSDINGVSNWDTSNVTNMSSMFESSKTNWRVPITNIDALSNWDTSNVTDMNHIFSNTSIRNIDALSDWDTSSVTNMSFMFYKALALTSIDGALNWNTSNVASMYGMFQDTRFTNINGALNWDTSNVIDMCQMFYNASIRNIDGALNWDTSNVINMSLMFHNANITNIDGASNWDTSNVTDMSSMFNDATALSDINGALNWDTSNVINMSQMFETTNYSNSSIPITNIDALSNWNTGSVTNMSRMFYGATALSDINGVSNWNTSNVTNMRQMFYDAQSLKDASPIIDWDVRNVGYFQDMFYLTKGDYHHVYYPIFTKRAGRWSYGSFEPNDTTSSPIITVNFDEHISSISFKPKTGSTLTVSVSGDTVSLTRGTSYTITATLASGYELALWNPGEHGVIGSNNLTINDVSFIASSDTVLTATSQLIPNDITTTINIDSNISKVTFCNTKYITYDSNTKTNCILASHNNDTITLKEGATYTITATTKPGYEIFSWTTTSGILSNNAGAHTNFTTNNNNTLTISSTTSTPTHTVTVNMDSNVSYVVFASPNWPTKVAISNAPTTELRDNTQYTITAYTKTGYELTSWSTTANGILGSTSANPTTYTVTDTAALTVTSQLSQ